MMKTIKRYYGWVLISSIVGIAVFAYYNVDSPFVKRINDITTILLALLTAVYVVFTYQILKSSRLHPHVYANLTTNEIKVYLSIKNIGSQPAYDVKITFEPSLDILAPTEGFKGSAGPLLKQPFMAPNSEISNLVSTTVQVLLGKNIQTKFNVSVRYKDVDGRSYSDEYKIDLSSFVFQNKFLIHNTVHYLEEISKTLQEISKSLNKET